MEHVLSRDGTKIAFDRLGSGPSVILIGGAFSYRSFPKMVELAELLAADFTVLNYDRRGRGDSSDTQPYGVERELEDLAALIAAAGGSASLWGWSSGGVLGLRAAARGLPVEKLALYEPPFIVDPADAPPAGFLPRLDELVASERRSDAVKHFMTKFMGVPTVFVTLMRVAPFWSKLKATAHTLPYDVAVLGETTLGRPLSADEWREVTCPTLVMAGEKTPDLLRRAADELSRVLPNAEHYELAKQSHNVSMPALAPVLAQFFRPEQPAVVVHETAA